MAIDSSFLGQQTIIVTGTQVAPLALSNYISGLTPILDPGWYRVVCRLGYGAVADIPNNMHLFAGGGDYFPGNPSLVYPGKANTLTEIVFERLYFGAVQVGIINTVNGAANTVYLASLAITRLAN